MTRRCLALLILLALAVPAQALAQGGGSNPFGPLPQQAPPPPEEPPEPQPAGSDGGEEDGLGGTGFWLITGTTALLFVVVGFLITRDMRRTVGTRRRPKRRGGTGPRVATEAKDALAGDPRHRTGSQKARAKAQKRAKTKAARKQRRRSRSR
jgi:hypothetical protein